jgi:tetratricopeptide (TPR) repeat protein
MVVNRKSFDWGSERVNRILPEGHGYLWARWKREDATCSKICPRIPQAVRPSYVTFLHQLRSRRYRHVCFIDSTSTDSVSEGLIRFVTSQGCEHAQKDVQQSLEWFAENVGWLMIFDDVHDQVNLSDFIPKCHHGAILITTRNKAVGWNLGIRHHLELEPMFPHEAVEALLNAAGYWSPTDQDRKHALAIVEELGCLPVAVIQAGRYIRERKCLPNYLDRLRDNRHKILKSAPTPSSPGSSNHSRSERSVYAVFEMSRSALPAKAREFLHLLSYFHYQTIPVSMILIGLQHSFSLEVGSYLERPPQFFDATRILNDLFKDKDIEELEDEIIIPLHKLSFVEIDQTEDERLLRLHPLVHSWAQDAPVLGKNTAYRGAAIRLLSSCSGKENRSLHQFLLPHINKLCPDPERLDLHPNDQAAFAEVLWVISPRKARALWESVHRKVLASRPVSKEEDAGLLLKLGKCYHYAGPLEKAREVDERALEIYSKECGPDHPNTIKARAHLGYMYFVLGNYSDAVQLQQSVYDSRRKLLGEDNLDTLSAAAKLGLTLARIDRCKEAASLQQHALERRMALLSEKHPDTMTSMSNLATTYTLMGQHKAALELRERVLALRSKVLGEDHVDTVVTSGFLAETYFSLERYDQALELQQKVLRRYLVIFKPDDPQVALGKSQLAWTYYKIGKICEAEKLASEACKVQRRTLAEDNAHYKRTRELLQAIRLQRSDKQLEPSPSDAHYSTVKYSVAAYARNLILASFLLALVLYYLGVALYLVHVRTR